MWFERLRLQGVGGFSREHDFTFESGWTVVAGGNESGKTSLAATLYGIFFGWPEGHAPLAADGPAWAEVECRVGARRFRVRRDFRDDTVALQEFKGASWLPADGGSGAAELESLLGLPEGCVWTRTGLVLQGRVETELDRAVRAWMTGEPRGEHEEALARLRADRERLLSTGGAAGALDEAREELAQRRDAAAGWHERATRLRDLGVRASEAAAASGEAAGKAREQAEMLESLTRFEELTRDRSRAEIELQTIREEQGRIRQHVERAELLGAALEKEYGEFMDAPGDVEEALQIWTDSAARRRDIESDLERTRRALYGLPASRTRRNGIISAAAAGVVGFLLFAGAGAAVLGLILIPALAGMGYGAVWYLDRNAQRVRVSREQELIWYETELEELEAREVEALRALGPLARYQEPARLRCAYRKYAETRTELKQARTVLESHRPLSELVEAYEKVFSQLQVLDAQIRDLVAQARYLSGLDADLQVLAAEKEKTVAAKSREEERETALREEAETLRAEIVALEAELSSPGHLAEDLRRLAARETELSREAKALDAAIEALQAAVRSYQEGHLDRVAQRTTEYLSEFSTGRYRAFRFGSGLEPQVRDGDDRWLGPDALSDAATHQVHLAIRLAAGEEVGGDRGLPLVLDEAFLGWDDHRLDGARAVLDRLAASGRQVIVLSADSRLASWSPRVIALSGVNEEVSEDDRKRRRAA